MSDFRLTENLWLHEFAVSEDYPELAKLITFTEQDALKAFYLSATILQPIRNRYGIVKNLSGKRPPALNQRVGGAEHSDHLWNGSSCADDFTLPEGNLKDCYQWIQNAMPFAFGQLILYPKKNFIHVSLPTPKHWGEHFIIGGDKL